MSGGKMLIKRMICLVCVLMLIKTSACYAQSLELGDIENNSCQKHCESGNEYFYNNKALDKALNEYNVAVKLDSSCTYGYNALGNTYYSKGLYNKAIQNYKIAISQYPEYSYAYIGLGNSYLKTGSTEKAIECYKKVLKINPNYASYEAYKGLSEAFKILSSKYAYKAKQALSLPQN